MEKNRDNVGEHTSEEPGDPGVVGSTLESDDLALDEATPGPPATAAVGGLVRKKDEADPVIDA